VRARLAEEDLHAYVDGCLGAAERSSVDQWLAAHPDEARRVAAYRVLGERWRAAYAPALHEPIPPHLLHALRPRRRHIARFAIAASVALVVAVVAWRFAAEAPAAPIALRAAMAHGVYAADVQHPVEAEGTAELLAWLSERLHMPVRAPDLRRAGYRFIGGRLLPGDKSAAALLMYEGQGGQRVTLYWAPEFRQPRDSGLVYASTERGTRVYYWLDEECGYAVASADLSQSELLELARLAEEDLEK
jgi:anti-sigma factor RsiW